MTESREDKTSFPPPRKLRKPSTSKLNLIYEKDTTARIPGEGDLKEKKEKMHHSQEKRKYNSTFNLIKKIENNEKSANSNSSAVRKAVFQTFGREIEEPMRCTETLLPRLDLVVTKIQGKVQHPDWSENEEMNQLSGIQQIRGGVTK